MPATICVQGANSKTFNPPPVNASLTVPEICDWHSIHSGQHPFFIYSDESTGTTGKILWKNAVQAIYRTTNSIVSSLGPRRAAGTAPLVGFYSSSDTLTYILGALGIMRAGVPVLLISNRTSPVALRHVISISGVSHILLNEDDPELRSRLSAAIQDVEQAKPEIKVTTSFIPPFTQLLPTDGASIEVPPFEKPNLNSLCIVVHSSGSTTLPRLNQWTHKMIMAALWQPWYGEQDVCGEIMSTTSIPMAGAAGVVQALFMASSGLVISGFKPTSPPTLANPQSSWKSLISTGSSYGFVLQPFLMVWSQDSNKTKELAKLKGVTFSGGPLPKLLGDKLTEGGVNIFPIFGSSEGGLLNTVFPKKTGQDWEWFSFYSVCSPGFRPEADDGTVELILKTSPIHAPARINTEYDGVPAFATGDLLQPHPSRPGYWKYVCRMVDQETIGPGRKINAVAFERLLMTDPLIAGAVLFSLNTGATFGVVIEPAATYTLTNDITDPTEVAKFKELIWPTLEHYNTVAPDPARLTKEKIIIALPDKPFTYGEKGMPRRKDAIAAYDAEIQTVTRPID